MKTTLQLFILLAIPFLGFSQKYDVQLGGYLLLNTSHVETLDQTSTFTFPLSIDNILSTEQVSRHLFEQGFSYDNRGSFSIGIGRTDTISKKLTYRLGLDLYNQRYRRNSVFNSLEFTVISTDTILSPPTTNLNPSGCDIILNESPLGETNPEDLSTSYNVYQLGLSGELKYSLIPHTLDVGLGISLRTPLHTSLEDRILLLTPREEQGVTLCSFEPTIREDNTGNNFRNMLWGATLSVDYRIWNDLIISVGVYNSFSDYHSHGEITNISQNTFTVVNPSIRVQEAFIKVRQLF